MATNDPRAAAEMLTIARSLNATTDLDDLLEKIGAAAQRLLDCEASAIMLVTDDKKQLYFRAASGEKARALKTMTLPIGHGIAGFVAQNRKSEVVNDCRQDPRFAGKFDQTSGFVTRSLVCVPMEFRGELVGVVEVLNKRRGAFVPEDVELLLSLASLASIAVSNAKIISDQKNFFSHVLELLAAAIESSRPRMVDHPARAARLACTIGRVLGVDDYEYRMLYYAGLLHDVGYIALQNRRLLAELGMRPTSEEVHAALAVKMLGGIKMLEGALPVIKHHHECYDGTGGPGKLKGEAIPRGARILALVEAMEELRLVGLPEGQLEKRSTQEAETGRGTRFDPRVVDAFLEVLAAQGGTW